MTDLTGGVRSVDGVWEHETRPGAAQSAEAESGSAPSSGGGEGSPAGMEIRIPRQTPSPYGRTPPVGRTPTRTPPSFGSGRTPTRLSFDGALLVVKPSKESEEGEEGGDECDGDGDEVDDGLAPLMSYSPDTARILPAHPPPRRARGPSLRRPFVPERSDPLYYRMRYYEGLGKASRQAVSLTSLNAEPKDATSSTHSQAPVLLFEPPESVIPWEDLTLFNPPSLFEKAEARGKQRSYQTIFSIYATLMGSGLLSVPWAYQEGGLFMSLITTFFICVISYYTATIILKSCAQLGMGGFEGTCRYFLGRPGYYVALFGSILVFTGVLFAFTVFMSQVLYNLVGIFPAAESSSYWTPKLAVFPVLYILFPFCLLEDIQIFIRISAMGVFCSATLIVVVIGSSAPSMVAPKEGAFALKPTLPRLAGLLMVGFFIHNAIVSMMKNQKHPEHNKRDLFVAFILVSCTYAVVGSCGYLGNQDISIPQSFLDGFSNRNAWAIAGRVALLVQQMVVFPLLLVFLRIQLFGSVFGRAYPGVFRVAMLNAVIFGGCILCGLFYRHVGDILRIVGAIVGAIYVFTLPILVHLRAGWIKRRNNGVLPLARAAESTELAQAEQSVVNADAGSSQSPDAGNAGTVVAQRTPEELESGEGEEDMEEVLQLLVHPPRRSTARSRLSWVWRWLSLGLSTAFHLGIPMLGLLLLILQFLPPSVW